MADKLLDALPKGFRDRTWVTARLAARLGVAAAKANFGLGSAAEADDAQAARGAEELVQQMGALKGLAMKVGQMASYLPGAMPPAAQRVLASLQASSVAMSAETIAAAIERELGAPPHQVFDTFEATAFAAASIGQVHRATFEGRAVAVKVQYPGIEEVLRADLDTVGTLATLATVGTKASGAEIAGELRQRLLEECDYRIEARNQRVFAAALASVPGAHVPTIVEARSTRRVLTSALAEGQRFHELLDHATQAERDLAGVRVYEGCFRPLFERGLFNADPHPGNYLFAADGGVTFLDFGCARTFDPGFIERWKRLALAVTDHDRAAFPRAFSDVGFVALSDKRFDWDAQWDALGLLYRPMREPEFRFTRAFVRETYDALLFRNPNKLRLAMPGEWVFLNRLQWGIFAILADLGAGPGVHGLWREVIESKMDPIALA